MRGLVFFLRGGGMGEVGYKHVYMSSPFVISYVYDSCNVLVHACKRFQNIGDYFFQVV